MTRASLGIAVVIALALRAGAAAGLVQAPDVRLHHLHYQVGDPGSVMNAAAATLGGTRVVLQGLGVGVRLGREFVLYDRLDGDADDRNPRDAAQSYDRAVAWLKGKGISATPAHLSASAIARAPGGRYHHVALAAADYDGVISRLAETPLKAAEDFAFFDAGGGLLVEIVRDTDRPDAFWCPMHPDIRSASPGTCPVCRMTLVPIPPPRIGEYRLDVQQQRGPRGLIGIRLVVREPDSNARVRSFATVHEKLFHLFIVSRDLEYFAHVHPEQWKDGSFSLRHELPPGDYMLIADFLPSSGTAQMVQRAIIVPGRTNASGRNPVALPAPDVRVAMETSPLVAGKEGRLTFTVTDAASGAPVTDLEPYLGAPAHLLLVRSDLGDALHEHPEEHTAGGPTISFHPLIPAAGDYKLWIQLQRRGRVLTFPFRLRAE